MPDKIKKILSVLGLLLVLWAGGFLLFTGSSIMAKPGNTDTITDAIVVLTGGDQRIQEGLTLFAAGRARHLFVTGVHPSVKKREITSMWEEETALPPCCLTLGHEATTTLQNARETREWIRKERYSSVRLVTANYHINRSLMEFRHALPDIEVIAHPVSTPDTQITDGKLWKILFSEYHKTLLRGIILFFIPREALEDKGKT